MGLAENLVFNIERLSPQSIAAHDAHELNRSPDGWSKIAPFRSHLNRVLHGPKSPAEGVGKILKAAASPHKSCTRPYFRILLSASPEWFLGGPVPPGGQPKLPPRPDRVNEFCDRSLAWLKDTFGERDLAHVALHLDETTPHLHVLLVPTYDKPARVPRKPKRGETAEQLAARQEIARSKPGKRTVSPNSHPAFKAGIKAFPLLRKSCAEALQLDVGQALDPDASPKTTRKWLQEQAREAEQSAAAAAADRRAAAEALAAAKAEQVRTGAALEEATRDRDAAAAARRQAEQDLSTAAQERAAAAKKREEAAAARQAADEELKQGEAFREQSHAAARDVLEKASLQNARIDRQLALAREIAALPPGDQDPTPARLAAGHELAHHLHDRPSTPPLEKWRADLRGIRAALQQAPGGWHLVAIWDALRGAVRTTLEAASLEPSGTAISPDQSLGAALTREQDYTDLVRVVRHRSPGRARRELELSRPVVAKEPGKPPADPAPGLSGPLRR